MITPTSLDTLLTQLLPQSTISCFSKEWILGSPKATDESIQQIYYFVLKIIYMNIFD